MSWIRIKRSVTDFIRGSKKTKHVKASKSVDEKHSSSMVALQDIDPKTASKHEANESLYLEVLNDAYYEPETLDIHRYLRYGLSSPLRLSAARLSPHARTIISNTQSPSSETKPVKPILEPLNTVKDLSVIPQTPLLPSTPIFADSPGVFDVLASPCTLSFTYSTPALSSPASDTSTSFTVPCTLRIGDFQLLEFLSKGSCGQVYLAKHKPSDTQLALKVIKKGEGVWNQPFAKRILMEEKKIMASLQGCDWFVQLEASWHDTNNIYLAMAYYPTDLESELIRCEKFLEGRARFYMVEIIIALEELHKRGIVHRDIKAANILVRADGHIVLADFGLAKDFGRTPNVAERSYQPYWPFSTDDNILEAPRRSPAELTFVCNDWCGSEMEMAPEIVRQSYYSFGVDYWSLGITLYAMVTGRHPWSDIPKQIIEDDVEFYSEDDISEECKDFIWRLLKKDPAERLRIGLDMTSHPFFAGVDWEAMRCRTVSPPWVPDFVKGHYFFEDWGTIEHPKPGGPLDKDEDNLPNFVYISPNLLQSTLDDSVDLQLGVLEESFSHLFNSGDCISDEVFCSYEFDEAADDARPPHLIDASFPVIPIPESSICMSPPFHSASSLVDPRAPERLVEAVSGTVTQCSQPVVYNHDPPESFTELTEPHLGAKSIPIPEVQIPQTIVCNTRESIVERLGSLKTECKTDSSVQCVPELIAESALQSSSERLVKHGAITEPSVPKLLWFATLPSIGTVVQFIRPASFQPVLEPLVECVEASVEPTADCIFSPGEQVELESGATSLYSKVKSWLKKLRLWTVRISHSGHSIVLTGRDDMTFWEGLKWKVKKIWVPKVEHRECLLCQRTILW